MRREFGGCNLGFGFLRVVFFFSYVSWGFYVVFVGSVRVSGFFFVRFFSVCLGDWESSVIGWYVFSRRGF